MVFFAKLARRQPAPGVANTTQTSQVEPSRIVGYHNAVEIDSTVSNDGHVAPLPSYEYAACAAVCSRPFLTGPQYRGSDSLPAYKCTVERESLVNIKFEKSNLFENVQGAEWTEAFMRLEGTILSIYYLQNGRRLSRVLGSPKPDRPGRLMKRYTLQHAEVGVAADMPKHELVPRTLASSMWPPQKMKRMQEEAPHLFDHVRQYIIRLRVECDQFVVRLKSWEDRAAWIDHLCMAIDIAPPLDERAEPKYHTLPRRRRQRTFQGGDSNRLTTSSLIEQQERIIRDRFPHLLSVSEDETGDASVEEDSSADNTADPEADDLDQTAVMTGQSPLINTPDRASGSFQTSHRGTASETAPLAMGNSYPAAVSNGLPVNQKPRPANQLDRSQELRCRRRCMPSLLYSSRRSNDVVIRDGTRWQIDWDSKTLKRYSQLPPDYGSHESAAPAATNTTSIHSLNSEQECRSSTTGDDSTDGSLNLPETHINPRPRSTVRSWKNIRPFTICLRKAERPGEDLDSALSSDYSEGAFLNKLRREYSGPRFQDDTMRGLGF